MTDRKVRKIYFSAFIALVLIILIHFLGWFSFLEQSARYIFTPILAKTHEWKVNWLKKKETAGKTFGKKEYEQLLNLQKEKTVLESQNKILNDENDNLRKLLNFNSKQELANIGAKVIGASSDNIERTIVITAGAKNGIKIGQPVVAQEGVLIGKISKVESDVSIVRLINDNNSKVAAMVLNKEKTQGVVEGGYGLSIAMNFIPRNEKVMVGDQIVTSGLENNIPRGLLIGTISAVENEAYQPFQKAMLAPVDDLSKISFVSVLSMDK